VKLNVPNIEHIVVINVDLSTDDVYIKIKQPRFAALVTSYLLWSEQILLIKSVRQQW